MNFRAPASAFDILRSGSSSSNTTSTTVVKPPKGSAIQQANAVRAKLDAKRNADAARRISNGLVFGADGKLAVVQATHSEAKRRRFGDASDEPAALSAAAAYKPLKFLTCSAASGCTLPEHEHAEIELVFDSVVRKYRTLFVDDEKAHAFMEYKEPREVVRVDPLAYAAQSAVVKDYFNVLVRHAKVHDEVFTVCARHLAEVDESERLVLSTLRNDVDAFREALEIVKASREAVRAQFTDAHDTVFVRYKHTVEFTTRRCVLQNVLVDGAAAVVPLRMQNVWRTYVEQRDENAALAQIAAIVQSNKKSVK